MNTAEATNHEEKTGTPHDEIMERSQAVAQWVLLCLEPGRTKSQSGLLHLGAPVKNVFARVVSVGPLCKTNIQKGDRVIFKECVGIKELHGLTTHTYVFVWEPNILGKESDGSVAPRQEGMTATPTPTIGDNLVAGVAAGAIVA